MQKKILLSLFVMVISILAFCMLNVSAETYGDLTYSVYDGEVTITDCDISATEVEIPNKIGDYPVTSIGDEAFLNCISLISITIPDSITNIEDGAFLNCSHLTGVHISNIKAWCEIKFESHSSNPLRHAKKLYLNGNLVEDLVIPNGITSIGDYAFYYCQSLTSVKIPDSVSNVGSHAFFECENLESVTLPNGLTNISDSIFSKCYSLISVTVPEGVENIGSSAFGFCYNLISVTLPDSVKNIGDEAFQYCDDLMSINLPDNLKSIGYQTFFGCVSLTSIAIPNSVTSIGNDAFYNCSKLTRVDISDIKAWCNIDFRSHASNPLYYAGCLYLNGNCVESLIIPEGVTKIKKYVFYNCDSLRSVTIPEGVESIGEDAFSDCVFLFVIKIPDSVTSIGDDAFYNCINLYRVTMGDGVTSIGSSAFYNCDRLKSITIPHGVTSIGREAFYDCESLNSIDIPDSVINIGDEAFKNCYSLTNIKLPENLEDIGEYAFESCSSLESITIPKSVERILDETFLDCISMKYVVLHKDIFYIRNSAFGGCTKIDTVFFEGTSGQFEKIRIYSGNEYLENANIIYNATKKTFKFETNCNNTLPDITAYAVFDAPVVENKGKYLLGWYENEDLSGEPVSFPYYGDATTFYAAWTDRMGLSFDDAFVAKHNMEYTITITESEQVIYYEIVPKISGLYKFYSVGDFDTYGYLYDSNKECLIEDNDSGKNNNFHIDYNLVAGEKYYIAAKLFSGVGTFKLVIRTTYYENTQTGCVIANSGEKIFMTTANHIPESAQIILACYNDGRLVDVQGALNKNETIYFVVTKEFDSAKIMVWESFDNLKPICSEEIIE